MFRSPRAAVRTPPRRGALVLALAVFLLPAGCGSDRPETVPVSGTVLLDGQPLKAQGTVRVIPKDARPATGQIDPATGRFTLTTFKQGDGCVPGTHTATVTARETINETQMRWNAPEKYGQPGTSGLKVTIEGPTDDLKIELQSDRAQPAIERTESAGDLDPARLD